MTRSEIWVQFVHAKLRRASPEQAVVIADYLLGKHDERFGIHLQITHVAAPDSRLDISGVSMEQP